MRFLRDSTFWSGMLIAVTAVFLAAAVYLAWITLDRSLGPYTVRHWVGWIGFGLIGINVPVFYFLRGRGPDAYRSLLKIHVFAGLLGAGLVALHFTEWLRIFFPNLDTGLLLMAVVLISVVSGFVLRFGLAGQRRGSWKFLHGAVALTFYLVVVIHILHGLGVI